LKHVVQSAASLLVGFRKTSPKKDLTKKDLTKVDLLLVRKTSPRLTFFL